MGAAWGLFLSCHPEASHGKALTAGLVPSVEAEVAECNGTLPHTLKDAGCGAPGWDTHVYVKPHAFAYCIYDSRVEKQAPY